MLTKDGKDVTLDEITLDNYACPKGEELTYHVIIEVKQYDAKTGQRISAPALQKFGIKMWQNVVYTALRKQGYELRVVHDPVAWLEANKKKVAELKAKQIATAKANKEAEREALKAEILAELKAAGVTADKKKKE